MKNIILFILILLFSNTFSQEVDSLLFKIDNAKKTEKAPLYNSLSKVLRTIDNDLSFSYAKKALEFGKQFNDSASLIVTNSLIGIYYYNKAIYDSSLIYFINANKISKNLKSKDSEAVALSYLSLIYDANEDYDKSINYAKEALKTYRINNDSTRISQSLNNIGYIYSKAAKYDTALVFLKEALQYKTSNNNIVSISYTYGNLGEIYMELGDFKNAEIYFNKSLDIFKAHNKLYNVSLVYLGLSSLNEKKGNYKEAEMFAVKSINLMENKDNAKTNLQAYYQLITVYDSLNDYFSAFNALKKYHEIKDTLVSSEKQSIISELQIKYETEKNLQELEYRKELIETRTNWLYIFIIAFIVTILLLLIAFIQKRKLNNAYTSMVSQNIEIVKYEEKLDISIPDTNEITNSKYSASNLGEDAKTMLELSISKIIRKNKLYLKNDFSINELAKLLDTSRSYVSQVVNERFGLNFSSFINEFRIKEAMRLLSKPENEMYTIDTIAKNVGFKSISAFNSAFKKVSGVTPSFFMKKR